MFDFALFMFVLFNLFKCFFKIIGDLIHFKSDGKFDTPTKLSELLVHPIVLECLGEDIVRERERERERKEKK